MFHFRLHHFKSKLDTKGRRHSNKSYRKEDEEWKHRMVKARMHPDDEKILIRLV